MSGWPREDALNPDFLRGRQTGNDPAIAQVHSLAPRHLGPAATEGTCSQLRAFKPPGAARAQYPAKVLPLRRLFVGQA